MPRWRACVISAPAICGAAGTPCSASRRPFIFPAICCFGSWRYRLQADHLGDLDDESKRLLDRSAAPEEAGRRACEASRRSAEIRPGTVLGREWNGEMHRVAVLAEGFAWNGRTYPSLSKIAFAITGTRWNGPRFFGLREKASKQGFSP